MKSFLKKLYSYAALSVFMGLAAVLVGAFLVSVIIAAIAGANMLIAMLQ